MSLLRITDDRGVRLEWRAPPSRVVSLVPSDTYSLLRLGAGARLVGRTRYCVAPEGEVSAIPIVGGTKDADVERIAALEPDLVVANQEENTRHDIARLEALGLRVLVSFPQRVAAGLAHLARLALALGFARGEEPAHSVVAGAYHAHHAALALAGDGAPRPVRVFVPIWMDPLMTVHASTFISDVLALVGAHNVFADRERRYPLAADLGSGRPAPRRAGRRPGRPLPPRDPRRGGRPRPRAGPPPGRAPCVHRGGRGRLSRAGGRRRWGLRAAQRRALPPNPRGRRPAVLFCDGKDLMWYGARSTEGLDRLRGPGRRRAR